MPSIETYKKALPLFIASSVVLPFILITSMIAITLYDINYNDNTSHIIKYVVIGSELVLTIISTILFAFCKIKIDRFEAKEKIEMFSMF